MIKQVIKKMDVVIGTNGWWWYWWTIPHVVMVVVERQRGEEGLKVASSLTNHGRGKEGGGRWQLHHCRRPVSNS